MLSIFSQNKSKRGFTPLNTAGSRQKAGNLTGFTFIEMTIVLVIISIVISLTMVGLNSVRPRTRDVKRVSDIGQLQAAVEDYRRENYVYPPSSAVVAGLPLTSPDGSRTYIKAVPTVPGYLDGSCATDSYTYNTQNSGLSYTIQYCLGTAVKHLSAGNIVAWPGSLGTPVAGTASTTTVSVLVVAGGGAGGGRHGGGGGGGGVVYHPAYAFSFGNNSVTVGNGGQPTETNPTQQSVGGNGGNSVFGSITALGGGGGGSYTAAVPTGGGSGGGGGGWVNYTHGLANQGNSAGGTGYGYNGGDGYNASGNGGGGGGGAGGIGSNYAGSASGGNGGVGLAFSISGASVYYAGGGGGGGQTAGGTGGNGGGGNGGSDTGTVGTINTGGGGGGIRSLTTTAQGKAGGSGVVIVSYPTGSLTAGGGTITTSGGNTIHTFTSSGTFSAVPPLGSEYIAPSFSPAAGGIAFGTTVTISSYGADAIYYTTDGSTPTTASTNQAVTPLVINSAITVKAIAVRSGYTNSAVSSTAYIENGLVNNWKLDNNYNDSNGTTTLSAVDTAPTFAAESVGYSGVFNDTGILKGTSYPSPSTSFSISTWYKTSSNQMQALVNLRYGSNPNYTWEFQVQNVDSTHVKLVYRGSLFQYNWNVVAGAGYEMSINAWHHAVVTSNNSTYKLYVDGSDTSAYVVDQNNPPQNLSVANIVRLGGGSYSYDTWQRLTGRLDDVRIYNRELSASEVTNIFNASKTIYGY